MRDYNIFVENSEKMSFFGKFHVAEDFLLFNHILLLCKFYIYSQEMPEWNTRTRRIYNIELHISRKRDKLNNHFKKWEKLISFFSDK